MNQVLVSKQDVYHRPLGAHLDGWVSRATNSIVRGFGQGVPLWGVTRSNQELRICYAIFCGDTLLFEGPGSLKEMEYVGDHVMYRVDTMIKPSAGVSHQTFEPLPATMALLNLDDAPPSTRRTFDSYQERYSQFFCDESVMEMNEWRGIVEARRREQERTFQEGRRIESLSAIARVIMAFPLKKWLMPHYVVEFKKGDARLRAPDLYSEIVYLSIEEERREVVCGALLDFNTYQRTAYTLS